MNLVIDLGNTSAKLTLFKGNDIEDIIVNDNEIKLEWIHEVIKDKEEIDACILCSVIDHPLEVEDYLQQTYRFVKFGQQTPVPIKNEYGSVETLGLDRLAAAVGGNCLFPGENILIVDFGTCIKYDVVSSAVYLGGGIAPGLLMRFKALHQFTDRLPLVQPADEIVSTGKTTEESIISGVQFGIASEMKGIVNHYREQFNDLKIVLTGGDAKYFENVLKNNIFAAPNLVSRGLNEVLRYNDISEG